MTLVDFRAESLYEACQQLTPINPDFANLPIEEGFNWSSCLEEACFDRLYLVVFRSLRRATADPDLLREYDDRAHADAKVAGGLLFYFKGLMNERRECLSFCLWESREQARRVAGGASHREAAAITAKMYESYTLERYELIRQGGRLIFGRLEEATPRGNVDTPGPSA
jgi:heme-degrading monooxygenase HmoA